MSIPDIQTRKGFEEWAMATTSVVSEDDFSYTVRLFDTTFVVCPKSDLSVTPCLVREGYWESWVSLWMMRNITDNHLFIDIGANCGYYSALASLNTFNVWAFEPNPDYMDLLMETAELNWVDMICFHFAISDVEGYAELTIPGSYEGSASIVPHDFSDYKTHSFEVETVPLDLYTGTVPEDMEVIIKIDAEGAEELIWSGSEEFRRTHRPTIIMEYTPGSYSKEFVDKLKEYGKLSYVDFDGNEQPIPEGMLEGSVDWLTLVVR